MQQAVWSALRRRRPQSALLLPRTMQSHQQRVQLRALSYSGGGHGHPGLSRRHSMAGGTLPRRHSPRIDESIVEESQTRWETLRKDLHQHPELGLEEHRTCKLVADMLEEWGLEVRRGVGGTGVVGTLRGTMAEANLDARRPSALGLRADMDCLPMEEANEFAHRSTVPGLFHGCGHDGHTTMLLGAAHHLSTRRDSFAGAVRFIFQPAEENMAGAKLMLDDGLLSGDLACDEVYGVHNWPYVEQGKMCVRAGPIMASADEFDVTINGEGGHAAMPHLTVDPVTIGAQLVNMLQTLVSRGGDPLHAVVLSVTRFVAGSAYNVIPHSATLSGTVRAFREEDRTRIQAHLERMVQSVCLACGATANVDYHRGYPPTVNTPEHADYARLAAERTVGMENVLLDCDPSMGAEDFSYMLDKVGGAYIWIGADSPGKLHEPNYDFDDFILPIGMQYFVNLVQMRLGTAGQDAAAARDADDNARLA